MGDTAFLDLLAAGNQDRDLLSRLMALQRCVESPHAAPVDGEIVEVNDKLTDNPSLVNEDPTGDAWFFKMKVPDTSAVDQFMDEDAYKALID